MNGIKKFGSICKLNQEELKRYLTGQLLSSGYTPVVGKGYVYAKGTIPVLVTAHMDTVHKETVKRYSIHNFKKKHLIKSQQGIGGDDRCGCYMILEIIKEMKPYVLFCEDEEIGGVGSDLFCQTSFVDDVADNINYMIELDRANEKDAVFYDCDNPEFTNFIIEHTGYKEAYGTFSDISNLMPETGIAGVNLSCGYYNAHTLKEYVLFEEMENTINVVKELLKVESKRFEYIEAKKYFPSLYGRYYNNYSYYDKYDSCYPSYGYPKKEGYLEVTYYDADKAECTKCAYGETEEEAFGNFFIENGNVCYNDVIDYWFV